MATTMKSLYAIIVIIGIPAVLGLPGDTRVGHLPALGWSSWNEYGCDINETVILNTAQHMVDLGLKSIGYEYVNIDDCWSDKALRRDDLMREIIVDYKKFPNGIVGLVENIHDMGLKVGIYSDAGTQTCGGHEGSLGYEDINAATFALWGIDYLKYDNCNVPREWFDPWKYVPELWFGGPPNENQDNGDPLNTLTGKPAPLGYDWSTSNTSRRYARMRDTLLRQEHPIEYSLCAWGHAHVEQWGPDTGHSWRMWGDIYPSWDGFQGGSWGIMPILNHASFFWNTSDFGGHSDWDMLEVGNGNLTHAESRSHFALWAALKSPLIIGTKLEGIKPEILGILSNKEMIAFNQDEEVGASARPYKWGVNPDGTWNQTHPAEFWVGQSSLGTHLFILNTLDHTVNKSVTFAEVPGLQSSEGQGRGYLVHDMWTGHDLGIYQGEFSSEVRSHDTAALRITLVNV